MCLLVTASAGGPSITPSGAYQQGVQRAGCHLLWCVWEFSPELRGQLVMHGTAEKLAKRAS